MEVERLAPERQARRAYSTCVAGGGCGTGAASTGRRQRALRDTIEETAAIASRYRH